MRSDLLQLFWSGEALATLETFRLVEGLFGVLSRSELSNLLTGEFPSDSLPGVLVSDSDELKLIWCLGLNWYSVYHPLTLESVGS